MFRGKRNSLCYLTRFYKYNSKAAWVGISTKFRGKEVTKCSSSKDPEKEFSLCSNKKKELFIGKAPEELYGASSIIMLVFIDSALGVMTYRQPLDKRSLQDLNRQFFCLLSLNNDSAKLSLPNVCMAQWQSEQLKSAVHICTQRKMTTCNTNADLKKPQNHFLP